MSLVFTTRIRDTAFKRSLNKVPLATGVKIDSAAGSFTLHKNPAKSAVFLAGGIGITPFLSTVQQANHDRLPLKLYLFYSNRQPEDAAFLDTLQTLETKNPNFHLICTMTEMSKSIKDREGRDGSDRQGDAVETFGCPAGTHLLHCRPANNGRSYAADACRRRGRRGRHSGRRVCRLLRSPGWRAAAADSARRSGVDFVSLVHGEKL
jgi:hypothetical protein